MENVNSFKDYLQTSMENIDTDWLKHNKLLLASSAAATLSFCGLTYAYYTIRSEITVEDDEISPSLSSKYSTISQGKHYYDYPDTLRSDWYNSIKFLKAYPLSYTLPNNGSIYYNEFGDPNGFPILHFHGSGGCNLEGIIYDNLARKYNLRIIVVDRPGHGRSIIPTNTNNKPYTFNNYTTDLSDFLQNGLKIPITAPIGISGASQGGVHAIVLVGLLGELGWNISFCLMMAGMPVTNIAKLLNEKNNDDNIIEYRKIYTEAIPKGTLDNYKLISMPWLYKMIGKGFTWYNKRQNFVLHKNEYNYNWALDFLVNNDLLPQCDIEEIKKPTPGQFVKIENNGNNDHNDNDNDGKEEDNELALDSYYFSKILGEYSYRFQEQTGERWTVNAQCNLDNNILEKVGNSLKGKKVLWYHGNEDRLIPFTWIKPYQEDLIKNGVEIVFEELENTGHFMFQFDNIEKGYKQIRKILDNGTD